MMLKMNRIYISISIIALLFSASCTKQELPASDSAGEQKTEMADGELTPSQQLLKSMLEGRDTKWTVSDLEIPDVVDGWNLITNDKELAYLLEFGSVSGEKYRLADNVDFSTSAIKDKLPGEIGIEEFSNFEFDGNGRTISGLNLPWAAGLFSKAKNVKVHDLTLDGCSVGSADNVSNLYGTGMVFGQVEGTLEVSGVKVLNSSVFAPCKVGGFVGSMIDADSHFESCEVAGSNVTSLYLRGISGWCGGFAGFIGRSDEASREQEVSVKFVNCDVDGGVVAGRMESDTRHSGKFLGTVNGYDYRELVILTGCTATPAYNVDAAGSVASTATLSADGLVGGDKYGRGTIEIDGQVLAQAWDGTTKKEPALSEAAYDGESGAYLVVSAAELAWFQGKTVSDKHILIRHDIDLGSHPYAPIYKADYIDGIRPDGKNCEIRNLKVVRENCGKEDGGAFIRQASGTTVHKNFTFRNADIKATHNANDIATAGGNAYCATLCGNMTGTYTMKNVHAYDGKLYGVNKMGGLLGRVYATATIEDCSVSGYYIENYEVPDAPETFTALGGLVSATFYPQGEVGGMIGFIHHDATISNCHVYRTNINAYHQADQKGGMVPGRHNGAVIGVVRTSSNSAAYTVTITNTSSDSETVTLSKANNKGFSQFSNASFIGKCYNVLNDDYSGTVKVDGTKVL